MGYRARLDTMRSKFLLALILLLHRLGLHALVARWLYRRMQTVSRTAGTALASDRPLRLLALSPNRFRGELESLLDTGGVQIFTLPFSVTGMLHSVFLGQANRGLSFYARPSVDPAERHLQRRFESVMGPIFASLLDEARIDAVISAALHYRHDLPFGTLAEAADVPYIVCHRESLHAAKHIRQINIARWRPIGRLRVSHIIVHNESARRTFIDAGVAPPDAISALGNPRMDAYVKGLASLCDDSKPTPNISDRPRPLQVTLFSFFHGNGMGDTQPKWSDGTTRGYVRLFEQVHAALARLAQRHPDVQFVIKTKWASEWWDKIRSAIGEAGIDPDDLPNLRLSENDDVHQLIYDSTVVCGFGSSTLLEAAIAGRPVVVPVFAEAAEPDYRDDVLLQDAFDCFDIAADSDQFMERIEERLDNPYIDPETMTLRRHQFERWLSAMDGQAGHRWVALIREISARGKKRHAA